MAWNDGISKLMSEAIDEVKDLGEQAVTVAKEVIDTEAKGFNNGVKNKIPVNTGGLKESFKFGRKTDKGDSWYGYEAEFEGNAPNGEPYEKIANILNYGTPTIAGSHFITKEVKKLKGMDNRIEARIEVEITKRTT